MISKKTSVTPESFITFGDLLRYLRVRAELTQRALAAQVGYHYSHLNRFEKNQRLPDRATLLARFVPALKIENEPAWVARLLELASAEDTESARKEPRQTLSAQNVYRLPASLTVTLGREHETTLMAKLLLQQDVRLLTIVGPPGVGKTRTALHLAEKISHNFAQGAVFVNLMPIETPEMVFHALAEALRLLETSTAPSLRSLQSFLQEKELLIVMDNFEQVLAAAPQLPEILGAAPRIKILATSREALRVQGEREFPLSPLSTPHESQFHNFKNMDEFPAIQLFVQRAVSTKPDFQLTEENASLVAEICHRLDGLPLAIELAAARIKTLSLKEMLAQFDRLFDWLTRGQRDTPAWRQTLLGAIEWSYGLLSEAERELLARLAVFSGGWTLESAEAVCSDKHLLKRNQILDLLSHLADRSLVVTEVVEDKTRYRFLDTIYHFAKSKLNESPQWHQTRNRHLEYFSGWVMNLEAIMDITAPLKLRSQMDVEINNIRTALDWGTQEQALTTRALALAGSAGLIWLKHSHYKEALEWVVRYLPLSQAHGSSHARLLFLAAALSYWRDNLADGLVYASQGLEVAREAGDKQTQAGLLYYLGDIHRENARLEPARSNIMQCIALCREIKNTARLSLALTSLGVIQYQAGDHTGANSCLEEALQIATHDKNLWAQSYALRVQADNLRYDGNFSDSYMAYERALTISSEIDDRISVGMELANMSLLANVLDDYSASAYYAKKAYSQFQAIGNEYQQPFPLRMLAYALVQQHDLGGARTHCMDSLKINQMIGHRTGVVACLVCLAGIIFAEGNLSGARSLLYTLHAEITANSITLMEPDAKALAKLRKDLKIGKTITKAGFPDLPQVLNDIGFD